MKNSTEFQTLPAVSVRSISQLLEIDRDTVRLAFDRADLQPVAQRGGYPAYDFRAAVKAIFSRRGDVNPETLTPADRKNLALAKRAEFELQVRAGEYLPRGDYRAASAQAFARIAQAIRSLPDNLERKAGLTPDAVQHAEEVVDAVLSNLADDLEKVFNEARQAAGG